MTEYNVAQLNTELLIKEIKARPCLYDKKDRRYNDVNYKRIIWDKVTKALFPKVWPKYDDVEKGEKADLVQKRWKNLRACFSRELKRQKDPNFIFGVANKRRKYVYFDLLSFLKTEGDDAEETTQEIDLPGTNTDDNTVQRVATNIEERPIPKVSISTTNTVQPKLTVETDSSKHTNTQVITDDNTVLTVASNIEERPIPKASIPTTNTVQLTSTAETDSSKHTNIQIITDDNIVQTVASNIKEHPISKASIPTTNTVLPTSTVETDSSKQTNIQIITNIQNTTIEESNANPPIYSDTNTNSATSDLNSSNFALSLVPILNVIPIDDRVEAEVEMLEVLYRTLKRNRLRKEKQNKMYEDCTKNMSAPTSQTYETNTTEETQTVYIEIISDDEAEGDSIL